MSSFDKTPSGPKIGPPKKLDPLKSPDGLEPFRVTIRLDELPEELAAACAERAAPYRHSGPMRKKLKKMRQAEAKAKRKAWHKRALERAKQKPRTGLRRKGPTQARILELAADWITRHELRIIMGVYGGLLNQNLDRAWKAGLLLKRKNPAWCGVLGWGAGVARCVYQYKRASGVQGEKKQGEKDQGEEAV